MMNVTYGSLYNALANPDEDAPPIASPYPSLDKLQIIPLAGQFWEGGTNSPRLSGETDQQWRIRTQAEQNVFADLIAQKYGFPNLEAMLQFTTGPGQFFDDPLMGRLWFPVNQNPETYNRSYVGAMNQRVMDPITRFVDQGGLVRALASAVLSPASQALGSGLTDVIGQTAGQAVGRGITGTALNLATGQSLPQSLKSSAISGAAGIGGEYASEALGLEPGSLPAEATKYGTSALLSKLLSDKFNRPETATSATESPQIIPAKSSINLGTTGAGQITPSSSALAQVLKTDMGAPIFGGEKEGKPQKWGEGDLTGSSALREMGSGIV